MELNGEAKLLRITVGSCDRVNGTPLYEVLVYGARKFGMAGATVTKGVMGFGRDSVVHTAKVWAVSDDLPVVVEIVDTSEKIDRFIEHIGQFLTQSRFGGIITTEKVNVLVYKGSGKVF
jgi:PII-like signaling protein